jgi:hypothetical protein
MPEIVTKTKPAATNAAALRTVQLPPIGEAWPGEGGVFAGLLKGEDGDYAVIVPIDPASDIAPAPWKEAIAAAGKFKTTQHQDYSVATRGELALCFHNVPEIFQKDWYWSSTPSAGDASCAWFQYFDDGSQDSFLKDTKLRARAVRRVKI